MKRLDSPSCRQCRYFQNAPLEVEAALPGLSALSSAYAAVRSSDGICAVHARYVAASAHCPDFAISGSLGVAGLQNPIHEFLALGQLIERDKLIGAMRLGDIPRSADHGRHAHLN